MKVTIMYRNSYIGGDGWTYHPLEIEISNYCQTVITDEHARPVKCCVRRGKPVAYSFTEDGENFVVHTWKNPCGHLDTYRECFFENKGRVDKLKKSFEEQNVYGNHR